MSLTDEGIQRVRGKLAARVDELLDAQQQALDSRNFAGVADLAGAISDTASAIEVLSDGGEGES